MSIRVVYANNGSLAFTASEDQFSRLVRNGHVEPQYSRIGALRCAVLMVPKSAAVKAMEAPASVGGPRGFVDSIERAKHNAENPHPDHVKQEKGAARWVSRVDMAGRGLACKGAKTLHFAWGFGR